MSIKTRVSRTVSSCFAALYIAFFTVIMSYLKSIEITLLLIALFIAIAPDKRVICISVVFKNQ